MDIGKASPAKRGIGKLGRTRKMRYVYKKTPPNLALLTRRTSDRGEKVIG